MDKTLKIFLILEEIPDISQRQLAKRTEYSLGTVNGILQRLIDDKEIVSKMLTPNHFVYELTPAGDAHKACLLYDFTIEGYEVIGKIKTHTKTAIENAVRDGIFKFYLYGEEDAIYRLVRMSLIEYKRKSGIDYQYVTELSDIQEDTPYKVIVWNKSTLDLKGNTLNILLSQ